MHVQFWTFATAGLISGGSFGAPVDCSALAGTYAARAQLSDLELARLRTCVAKAAVVVKPPAGSVARENAASGPAENPSKGRILKAVRDPACIEPASVFAKRLGVFASESERGPFAACIDAEIGRQLIDPANQPPAMANGVPIHPPRQPFVGEWV